MAAVTRWPICLRLPAGGVDLVLPAALVEQVLPCEPVELQALGEPGWHREPDAAGSVLARLRFVAASGDGTVNDTPWTASWIAVLRRFDVDGSPIARSGVLLSAAPELFGSFDESLQVVESPATSPEVARVRIDGAELVVPDVTALPHDQAGDHS